MSPARSRWRAERASWNSAREHHTVDLTSTLGTLAGAADSHMLFRIHVPTFGAVMWCAVASIACGGAQSQPEARTRAAETARLAAGSIQGSFGVYVTNEVSGDLSVIDPATHRTVARDCISRSAARPSRLPGRMNPNCLRRTAQRTV
jgi:hypothetical protein